MENQHIDSAVARSSIGSYAPSQVGEIQDYVDPTLYATWSSITGLSATVSDVLDDLGYKLAVPTSEIPSVFKGARVVGRAVTLKYLPERKAAHAAGGHLAHQAALAHTQPGDVLVIEGDRTGSFSVLGGLAALKAKSFGIQAVIVDGAIRDVDDIEGLGLPVWSKGVTCLTGRGRVEGVGINVPIQLSHVQVCPGDIVVADDSGICFIPSQEFECVAARVQAIVEAENIIKG